MKTIVLSHFKKRVLFFLLLVAGGAIIHPVQSQLVYYTAEINPVCEDGYYQIVLSQEIIATSANDNLSDLRVLDGNEKEIPYFIRSESLLKEESRFIEYPLVENISHDSVNVIIVDNTNRERISGFYIRTTDADVTKYARVRGSNDRKQWYIVKKEEEVTHSGFRENGQHLIRIHFPEGNYAYYEVNLFTNQKSPLEVTGAGKINTALLREEPAKIYPGKPVQKDSSDKKTYVYFPEMKYDYRVVNMRFYISTPTAYLRNGFIRPGHTSFSVSSGTDNTVYIPSGMRFAGKQLILENNDNLPLKIDSVSLYGPVMYICAYLEKETRYQLEINPHRFDRKPDYDIVHFSRTLPETLPVIYTSRFESRIDNSSVETTPRWFEKPVVMWGVIVLLGIFLIGVCLKMMKEMKK